MAKITLRNSFHNTEISVSVKLSPCQMGTEGFISARQARRAEKALCGISTCTCGSLCGTRGPQTHKGLRISMVGNYQGGVSIRIIDWRTE